MIYSIVESHGFQTLCDSVNALIPKGWTPLGGVAVATTEGGHTRCVQAMVKLEGQNELPN